jgi:hypothetical protein
MSHLPCLSEDSEIVGVARTFCASRQTVHPAISERIELLHVTKLA